MQKKEKFADVSQDGILFCPCPFFLSSVSGSYCPRRGQQIRKSRTFSYIGNIYVQELVLGIE